MQAWFGVILALSFCSHSAVAENEKHAAEGIGKTEHSEPKMLAKRDLDVMRKTMVADLRPIFEKPRDLLKALTPLVEKADSNWTPPLSLSAKAAEALERYYSGLEYSADDEEKLQILGRKLELLKAKKKPIPLTLKEWLIALPQLSNEEAALKEPLKELWKNIAPKLEAALRESGLSVIESKANTNYDGKPEYGHRFLVMDKTGGVFQVLVDKRGTIAMERSKGLNEFRSSNYTSQSAKQMEVSVPGTEEKLSVSGGVEWEARSLEHRLIYSTQSKFGSAKTFGGAEHVINTALKYAHGKKIPYSEELKRELAEAKGIQVTFAQMKEKEEFKAYSDMAPEEYRY